jgi:hypothetical protein
MTNYRRLQQEMTELNSDGNEDRGRYGEDYSTSKPWRYDEDLPPTEQIRKEQAQDIRNG